MIEKSSEFLWTRYPSTTIEVPLHREDPVFDVKLRLGKSAVNWHADSGFGAWRNFPDIVEERDEAAALAWVQRYGDPFSGTAATKKLVTTRLWEDMAIQLRSVADLWSKAGADGFSRFQADQPFEIDLNGYRFAISKKGGFEPIPVNLYDFCIISACTQAMRQVPMRRCETCAHWFAAWRSTGRVCSNRCGIMKSRRLAAAAAAAAGEKV